MQFGIDWQHLILAKVFGDWVAQSKIVPFFFRREAAMAFKVLSIDGGGMRGIYVAAYLGAVERFFAKRIGLTSLDIGKGFDLIVGTSTGAIIGCGLAKGVRPIEMVNLYRENGKKIFPLRVPSKPGPNFFRQLATRPTAIKKGERALREALTGVFQQMTVGQLWEKRRIALAVPAVNMKTYKPRVFKTPHNVKTDDSDTDRTLVDVCLASSAAPIYRTLAVLENPNDQSYDVFADGGVWANNPVLVAVTEALRMLKEREDEETPIEVYCLGSCGEPKGAVIGRDETARGLQHWKFGGEVAQLSIAAQENAFAEMVGLLIPHFRREVKVVKFPAGEIPTDLTKYLDLDETSEKGINALISKANDDASKTNSEVQKGSAEGILIESLFSSMSAPEEEES